MNWKRVLAVMFALLVGLSIASGRLAAQTNTTGDVTGVITDPSGSVVPDAKISIKSDSKGSVQETTSNREGTYRFYLLTPGSYTATVTSTGFQSESRHVDIAVGQIVTLSFKLSLGASSTSVTVTEESPLVQVDNGDTSTALTQQQVANVPNPGNDLTAIAQLAPGVIVNSQGGYGNVEAFGMPATSNLFTMNGMDDNDPFLNLGNSGATNLLLGSNEVQEADVVSNAYTGSFGTFSGLQVNYITKSGGNAFHGNAVYYWNGSAMNANDWFNNDVGNPKPFSNANQWAASIGGPIVKDKLFFFLNTEGLRVLIPVPSTIPVPSQQFEGSVVENLTALGDAQSIPYYCQNLTLTAIDGTAVTCPAGVPGAGVGVFNVFNNAKGYSGAQNSFGGGGCDNVGTGVGAGNIFANAGAANPCTLSLRTTPVTFAPEWQLAGRVDWNIGANDRAYMRVQYDVGTQPTYTDPLDPVFNAQSYQPEYQGQLNETHVFSPTLTNQFLVAATWYSAIFKSPDIGAALALVPNTIITNDGALPFIGGENFAFPQGRNVTQFQIGDDVSKTLGQHTLKFGIKFHQNYVSDHDLGANTEPVTIPLTLADFANGGDPNAPGTVGSLIEQNFALNTNVPIRIHQFGGYIQDDFRITSNFTISPALRIEHSQNPECATNCFGQFSAPFADIVADPTAPYNQQLEIGRSSALLKFAPVQWEPRISFAWQPFGSSSDFLKKDFVIRGGIGIFNDIFPGQIADLVASNPPLVNAFTIASTGIGGTCPGYLSPQQFAGTGQNLFDCATSANSGFNTVYAGGGNTTEFAPSVTYTAPKINPAQYQKWSLEIQKGFGANDSIYVGYFGNHGVHEPIIDNAVNAFGLTSELPAVAPTSQFGTVTQVSSVGVSNYNGIVASYKHRFSGAGGGLFQFNYTYGHAFDIISNGGFNPFSDNPNGGGATSLLHPQDPYNYRLNYGPADYDVRHSLNANYVWQVPVRKALGGHGWAPLVDGWQVSGAVFYRTGFPFSVIDSSLTGANNYGSDILPTPTGPISSLNCNSESHFGQSGLSGNTCGFAYGFYSGGSPSTTPIYDETNFGNLRNRFRGPSYFDTDFSFTKRTKIPGWERGELAVGLQFFNLFNHPNFNLPSNDVTNPYFGTVQATVNPPTSILGSFLNGDASPRLIQVKASLNF